MSCDPQGQEVDFFGKIYPGFKFITMSKNLILTLQERIGLGFELG